jgi:hypothetical protein
MKLLKSINLRVKGAMVFVSAVLICISAILQTEETGQQTVAVFCLLKKPAEHFIKWVNDCDDLWQAAGRQGQMCCGLVAFQDACRDNYHEVNFLFRKQSRAPPAQAVSSCPPA